MFRPPPPPPTFPVPNTHYGFCRRKAPCLLSLLALRKICEIKLSYLTVLKLNFAVYEGKDCGSDTASDHARKHLARPPKVQKKKEEEEEEKSSSVTIPTILVLFVLS